MFQCVPACCSVLQSAAESPSPGSPHLVCMYVGLFGMRSHMMRRDSFIYVVCTSYLRTQPTPSVAVSVCLYPHPRTTPTHCLPSHRVQVCTFSLRPHAVCMFLINTLWRWNIGLSVHKLTHTIKQPKHETRSETRILVCIGRGLRLVLSDSTVCIC